MNFVKCTVDDHNYFVVYDTAEILDSLGFKIVEKDIKLDTYPDLPLLSQVDIILRKLKKGFRSDDKILAECNVESWNDLYAQYHLIQNKTSKLSKSQRDIVVHKYESLTSE